MAQTDTQAIALVPGLLKMGDYYYSSSRLGAVDQAISLYSRAALAGSSQVSYHVLSLSFTCYN